MLLKLGVRLLIPAIIAGVALYAYYSKRVPNEITDEVQHISLTIEQEVALGLQAAPQLAAQYGGLHPDEETQKLIDIIGHRIVENSEAAKADDYQWEFHVLADENMVNAFALPGGQVFITQGLLKRFDTESQIAGVLAHEIAHVVARHGAEHIAKAQLTQGLTAAAIFAAYDSDHPNRSRASAVIAAMVGQLLSLRYSRNDELESDRLGVQFMIESGYDPHELIRVMEVLHEASGGGGGGIEFFQTHPSSERRIEEIKEAIEEMQRNV